MSLVFQPPPHRILIRGVNWLGDAVMTTPALLRLREAFPAAKLVLLTPQKLAGLWAQHPAVDEILSFDPVDSVFAVSKKLRAAKCDLALVLPNSPRSALEVCLAGIPRRIGYARPWRNLLLTQTVPTRPGTIKMRKRSVKEIRQLIQNQRSEPLPAAKIPAAAHQMHEYLHLTSVLGARPEALAPLLEVSQQTLEAAQHKFGWKQLAEPVLGLNPGAEYGPAKRWPVEKFIVAARQIEKQTGCSWVIFGGNNDAPMAAQIAAALSGAPGAVLNLAGRTSLIELMCLLKSCRVLVTNDTGPMHVAAALGTPVVVPFGSTSPGLTSPGLPGDSRHHFLTAAAPCSPCFLRECPIDFRCLNNLDADRVVTAVLEVLGNAGK
jgi:heptosyltransferase-2